MAPKNPYLPSNKDFPPPETQLSLTVRDLVEVRELYHSALSLMPNVIGTAIGLYRFRRGTPGYLDDQAALRPREENPYARTPFNSRVSEDSDPAILVFVREWIPRNELPRDPRFIIPQFLYLPDGRAVCTCIIQLSLEQQVDPTASDATRISFPENLIGGGCGIYTRVQGRQHVGTVACLVTDGERLYGLTSRHVVGPPGERVYTRIRGKEKLIGESDARQVQKKRFRDVYPEYKGGDAIACLDAGLIRIDQADWWTSQVLYIGNLGDVADLHTASITLGMIGTPLRSAGAASADQMRGEISGLFPRYRGMGGTDYMADVLIGPRPAQKEDEFRVGGGDSGSLWVLDRAQENPRVESKTSVRKPDEPPMATPVAVTWAAVDLVGGGVSRQLVLGTFASTICKGLDVELVSRQNIGYRPVWGAENHRTFASVAVGMLDGLNAQLRRFLLGTGTQSTERKEALRELAVLPDHWRNKRGRHDEGPNHYADIDKVIAGRSLASIELTPEKWLQFYRDWEREGPTKHGALPFRVGQVFEDMVTYLSDRNYSWAYAAAGAILHYVADACNPAHVTIWTKGDPDWTSSQNSRFHSIWDNETIIDAQAVQRAFNGLGASPRIDDGPAATKRTLELMKQTLRTIRVGDFVVPGEARESYAACRTFLDSPAGRRKLAQVVARGCALLFSLWTNAWRLGDGRHADFGEIAGLDVAPLHDEMLNTPEFLPSISLQKLATTQPA